MFGDVEVMGFSFVGEDEGDTVWGRGWGLMEGQKLRGQISIKGMNPDLLPRNLETGCSFDFAIKGDEPAEGSVEAVRHGDCPKTPGPGEVATTRVQSMCGWVARTLPCVVWFGSQLDQRR